MESNQFSTLLLMIKSITSITALQIFSHIWEKYFSYSEKLVVPNLWPSVYYTFSTEIDSCSSPETSVQTKKVLWFVEYPTGTKNSNFVEDHPRNIPAKFGSNWPSGFGEEAWNVKSLQTTDDGRQVMAIVHLDLLSDIQHGYHMLWLAEISKIFFSETNELTEPKL
jgi:hypothetical protein